MSTRSSSQHLARRSKRRKQKNEPLRIVFYAHGGLVKESLGLAIAHKHLAWWKANGVYPIYFVWETGLFETLGQLLRRRANGTRGIVVRLRSPIRSSRPPRVRWLGGPTIWGGMKLVAPSARWRPDSPHGEGGARYVAAEARRSSATEHGDARSSCTRSATARARSSTRTSCRAREARRAVVQDRCTCWRRRSASTLSRRLEHRRPGQGVDRTTIFTMSKDYERADNCGRSIASRCST